MPGAVVRSPTDSVIADDHDQPTLTRPRLYRHKPSRIDADIGVLYDVTHGL
jgi:hypothetical protein